MAVIDSEMALQLSMCPLPLYTKKKKTTVVVDTFTIDKVV